MDLLDRAWLFVVDSAITCAILWFVSRNDRRQTNEVKEVTSEIWVQPEPNNPSHKTQLIAGLTHRQTCKLASHIQQGKPLTYRAVHSATGISAERWKQTRIDLVGRRMASYGTKETLILAPNWREWVLEQLSPTAGPGTDTIVTLPPHRQTDNKQPEQSPVGGWVEIKKGWKP